MTSTLSNLSTLSGPATDPLQAAAPVQTDRVVAARVAREDADAAVRRRIADRDARAARARADRVAADARVAARRTARATARMAARARVAAWISGHAVELLVYPIAVVSFALAAPAMAAYGHSLYGPVGVLLAGITELGMWAFALAVAATRHRNPERPVVTLQGGVVLFSLVAAGMNFLHGLHQPGGGPVTGLVMAIVSIAGVAAHQLTVAAPPRPRADRRADRRAARVEALIAARTARARRLAVTTATAVISADGTAELVYRPGTYHLRHRRLIPTKSDTESTPESRGGSDTESRPDLRRSTRLLDPTVERVDLDLDRPVGSGGRSLDELRALLSAAVAAGRVDAGSAESIRRVLRCSASRARHLRDQHNNEHPSTDQHNHEHSTEHSGDGGERR